MEWVAPLFCRRQNNRNNNKYLFFAAYIVHINYVVYRELSKLNINAGICIQGWSLIRICLTKHTTTKRNNSWECIASCVAGSCVLHCLSCFQTQLRNQLLFVLIQLAQTFGRKRRKLTGSFRFYFVYGDVKTWVTFLSCCGVSFVGSCLGTSD